MERKLLAFKALASDLGSLEGYGSVTGNVDLGGDMILPGAYRNLDGFKQSGSILLGHDWGSLPVATIDDAQEREEGLWFRASWHSDDRSQTARKVVAERLERGKSVGLSIGYDVVDASWETRDGREVRVLKGINVYEVSVVTVPMNPAAGVTAAKSFEDEYEQALAAVRSLSDRAGHLKALREKQGRSLSDLNRQRIEALAAETEALAQATKGLLSEPAEYASEGEVAQIRLAMERLRLSMAGL